MAGDTDPYNSLTQVNVPEHGYHQWQDDLLKQIHDDVKQILTREAVDAESRWHVEYENLLKEYWQVVTELRSLKKIVVELVLSPASRDTVKVWEDLRNLVEDLPPVDRRLKV